MGAGTQGRRLLAIMLGSSDVVPDTALSRVVIDNVTGPVRPIGGRCTSDSRCFKLLQSMIISMLRDVRDYHVSALLMGHG